MGLRVAFSGASGTGKTALAREVAERYGIPINPVGSRSVSKDMGFDTPYDVDRADRETWLKLGAKEAMAAFDPLSGRETVRAEFQTNLQLQKILWETENESFVTDRTTADDFVYSAMHSPKCVTKPFVVRAVQHLSKYDVIFFTPISAFHNVGDDRARMDDLGYHLAFETMVVALITDWGNMALISGRSILRHRVSLGDLEYRKTFVFGIIDGLLEERARRG